MSCGYEAGRRGKTRTHQEDGCAHSQGPCPTDAACAETQGKRTLAGLRSLAVTMPSLQGRGEPGLKDVPGKPPGLTPELGGTDLGSPQHPSRGGVEEACECTPLHKAPGGRRKDPWLLKEERLRRPLSRKRGPVPEVCTTTSILKDTRWPFAQTRLRQTPHGPGYALVAAETLRGRNCRPVTSLCAEGTARKHQGSEDLLLVPEAAASTSLWLLLCF